MKTIAELAGELSYKRAGWIDSTLRGSVPLWKITVLERFPNKLLARLLNVNVEIIYKHIVDKFGITVILKLNGEVVGSRYFPY